MLSAFQNWIFLSDLKKKIFRSLEKLLLFNFSLEHMTIKCWWFYWVEKIQTHFFPLSGEDVSAFCDITMEQYPKWCVLVHTTKSILVSQCGWRMKLLNCYFAHSSSSSSCNIILFFSHSRTLNASSQLHDFWRLDYWEDDLRRRRRFVRNAFGSTHADVSLKALEDYGQLRCCDWSSLR